jgi:cholesterol transport system auxiliary component
MIRPILVSLCLAALSGCAAVSAIGRASEVLDAYELQGPAAVPVARSVQGIQFIVEVPTASGAIDTDRILVRPSRTQVQYLPDSRWTVPAPEMLQSAMVATFLRTGAFRFVGARPLGVSGDVALVTTLLEFGAVIAGEGAVIEVTLVARLVREDDSAITATRTISQRVPVPDTRTPTLIAGYEAATDAALAELAAWVLSARGVPAGPS